MLATLTAMLALAAPPEGLPPLTAKPAPELDALFQRTDGWIGADGCYSVALTADTTLWLYSDTFVGSVRDGKRTGATMVNNTAAIQRGRGPGATVEFFVRRGPDGKPAALVTPADGKGWYWPWAAALVDGKLYVFLAQIEKAGEGAFGFRQVAQWLGVVANPHDPPTDWRIAQLKLPFAEFARGRSRNFGSAVLRDGEYLYVYGIEERRGPGLSDKGMIVARVPADRVADFAAWRFFKDGQWQPEPNGLTRLAGGMGNEYSVAPLPKLGGYVAVTTELGLSPRIVARTAPAPWGPWSPATLLYECPEMARDKQVFSYAAKAHPMLAGEGELIVTYCVNAFDFWQVCRDAQLYWPRFVRVTLADRSGSP